MRIEEQIIDGVTYKTFIYEESDYATDQQKADWESTCSTCEHYREDGTCGACGCILEALMNLATATCPEGKW